MKTLLGQGSVVACRMQHLAVKHANRSPVPSQDTVDPLRGAGTVPSIWEIDHVEQDEERVFLKTCKDTPIALTRPHMEQLAALMLKSETFDRFMAKRFGQVKRYGLEGGEGMMVCLQELLHPLNAVIGMPHRGRLNLMTGLLKYPLEAVFAKLKGHKELPDSHPGSGDVLSHLWTDTSVDRVRHVLLPNPSHLEAINAVHMGVTRSLGASFLPIQIHGDAAFAGQGIIQEALMLSQLPGFTVNGTVHVVLNNQLGFTTPSHLGRSTRFASDALKMLSAPVFHVSGDDIAEIVRVTRTALAYRQTFRKDVGIDIVCYRKMGHNELDEPAFTQPAMYSKIRSRPLPGSLFAQAIQLGSAADAVCADYFEQLDAALSRASEHRFTGIGLQSGLASKQAAHEDSPTAIKEHEVEELIAASVHTPHGFQVHPRLQKMHLEGRLRLFKESKRIDWATAEALCFASLLKEGHQVRLSGQDVGRGTFSHRHAILYDQRTNAPCIPLHCISTDLEIVNSPLSELAVLGFEYGQSIAGERNHNKLVIWEAQFGDFFNGAQAIIDTFIVSGEQKWGLQSGLVLLLPHGYNGAGPEHSSSRIERFLQQSDEPVDQGAAPPEMGVNIQVAQPTTPANYFHLLRRQLKRNHRKPLVVASAKQLLRLPAAQSPVSALCHHQSFHPILYNEERLGAKCCIFTSGEIAYELEKEFPLGVLVVRLEQLCPFPRQALQRVLAGTSAGTFVYCQPEPENMGAWKYVRERLEPMMLGKQLHYVGRTASAAPATGYAMQHSTEQQAILERLRELVAAANK